MDAGNAVRVADTQTGSYIPKQAVTLNKGRNK